LHFDGTFNPDRTTMVLRLAGKVREAAARCDTSAFGTMPSNP
jgi:hypothetical protein